MSPVVPRTKIKKEYFNLIVSKTGRETVQERRHFQNHLIKVPMTLNKFQVMNNKIIFGNPDLFSIVLSDFNSKHFNGRLQFIFNSDKYGSGKVKDSLAESIIFYKRIVERFKSSNLPSKFDDFSELEIFKKTLFDFAETENWGNEQYDEIMFIRNSYEPYFGEQFCDTNSIYFLNKRDIKFIWITSNNFSDLKFKIKDLKNIEIQFEVFEQTFNEYENYLKAESGIELFEKLIETTKMPW